MGIAQNKMQPHHLAPEALDTSKHNIKGRAMIKASIDDLLSVSIFKYYLSV